MAGNTTIHVIKDLTVSLTDLEDGTFTARLKLRQTTFAAIVAPDGQIFSPTTEPANEFGTAEAVDWLPDEVQKAIRKAVRQRALKRN